MQQAAIAAQDILELPECVRSQAIWSNIYHIPA